MHLFVTKLSKSVGPEELRTALKPFGSAITVDIPTYSNGELKGYAFVELDENESIKGLINSDKLLVEGVPAFVKKVNPGNEQRA